MDEQSNPLKDSNEVKSWSAKAMQAEWLGQTIASICWISSVFVYGISSGGDWLQLIAASSWLFANIASLKENEVK